MSWSATASGTPDEIRAEIRGWAEQVAEHDRGNAHLTRDAKIGHALQVGCAIKTAEALLDNLPTVIGISASGHAGDDGGGHVSVNYTLHKP